MLVYKLVPFSEIKESSKELIPEIAEGNVGLEYLLDTCVADDIETYSSCGDVHPYISFVINDQTKKTIYNLCQLLLNNDSLKDSLSINLGFIDNTNICEIRYYDNDDINIVDFFVIITNYLKKIDLSKEIDVNTEVFDFSNEVVKSIGKYGFNNYLEIIKNNDLPGEDNYEYYLTIHSTSFEKIYDFRKETSLNLYLVYKNKNYEVYSICFYIDNLSLLQSNYKKLVRKIK